MSKFESIVVGLFVGIACPLLAFTGFWWLAGVLHLCIPGFPLYIVIVSASIGLLVGLLLDIFFLRKWVKRFYLANLWLMRGVYLGLCAIAVAFFMGFPVGTFVLGILAGVYMGRRERHAHPDKVTAGPMIRRTALMVASVTTLAALPIGFFALKEPDVLALLERLSGFSQDSLRGCIGLTIVGLLCIILFLMQYWFTNKAGKTATKKISRTMFQASNLL